MFNNHKHRDCLNNQPTIILKYSKYIIIFVCYPYLKYPYLLNFQEKLTHSITNFEYCS